MYRNSVAIGLSPRADARLATPVRRPAEAITRAQLLREVWGYSSDAMSRTVDMHVVETCRKLEGDPAKPRHVHTVRNTAYRFTRGWSLVR